MKKVIKDIDKMVSPVVTIAYDLQAKQGDIGIKKLLLLMLVCSNDHCALMQSLKVGI